ncbi:MAG: hypothetical protein KJ674_00475 [Nanoarchaeota archaeon]|nr:hypothetical protein [Nanoarchaeota archaeon]
MNEEQINNIKNFYHTTAGKVFLWSFIIMELFGLFMMLITGDLGSNPFATLIFWSFFSLFVAFIILVGYLACRRGHQIGTIIEDKYQKVKRKE